MDSNLSIDCKCAAVTWQIAIHFKQCLEITIVYEVRPNYQNEKYVGMGVVVLYLYHLGIFEPPLVRKMVSKIQPPSSYTGFCRGIQILFIVAPYKMWTMSD